MAEQGHPHVEETYQSGDAAQNHDTWDRDLHPNRTAGAGRDAARRTAYDLKPAHRQLSGYTDDDLKQVSLVPDGTRLEQGSTYIDLLGDRREFTATGEMSADDGHAYVAKSDVDYQLWNRLIGVANPERTGQADDA